MGDRGNIAIIQNDTGGQVWFYSHWNGTERGQAVHNGLVKAKDRWNDEPYLARSIFCQWLKIGKQSLDGVTGFGISCRMQDNEYPIVVVDIPNQRVYEIGEKELKDGRVPDNYNPKTFQSFDEFVTLKPAEAL